MCVWLQFDSLSDFATQIRITMLQHYGKGDHQQKIT